MKRLCTRVILFPNLAQDTSYAWETRMIGQKSFLEEPEQSDGRTWEEEKNLGVSPTALFHMEMFLSRWKCSRFIFSGRENWVWILIFLFFFQRGTTKSKKLMIYFKMCLLSTRMLLLHPSCVYLNFEYIANIWSSSTSNTWCLHLESEYILHAHLVWCLMKINIYWCKKTHPIVSHLVSSLSPFSSSFSSFKSYESFKSFIP